MVVDLSAWQKSDILHLLHHTCGELRPRDVSGLLLMCLLRISDNFWFFPG